MMMSDHVRLDPEKSLLRVGGGWMQIMQFGGASWAVLAPWQQHQAVFGV
jgi:hypothetical protein